MKGVKIADIFTCDIDILKPLFSAFVYPWEILPNIKNYINELIASGLCSLKQVKEGVFVGENVKISDKATIEPPAIILDGSEIRTGAYIRGNVIIGRKCVVGNSSELKNCILLDGVQVPHYNYVGDSILGNGAHMGAGSVCSNLKADKKNIVIHGDVEYETNLRKIGAFLGDKVDVGCNCVLNPGTIIGKNTNVYPLTSVRGVIENNSIVKSMDNIVKKI